MKHHLKILTAQQYKKQQDKQDFNKLRKTKNLNESLETLKLQKN